MEDSIYRNYQNSNQSLNTTINLIEDILRERILPDYRSISVGACNSNKITFCITVFPKKGDYLLLFHSIKNMRQWRPSNDDESFNKEIVNIERIIENLRSNILGNIIS